MFDGAFQQSFEYIHGPRCGEGLLARTFEPLAPDETELDGLGHAIGITLQEIGDADGGRTAKPMHRIRAGAARVTGAHGHCRSALVHVARHQSGTLGRIGKRI